MFHVLFIGPLNELHDFSFQINNSYACTRAKSKVECPLEQTENHYLQMKLKQVFYYSYEKQH